MMKPEAALPARSHVLKKVPSRESARVHEYLLTEKGRQLYPVLLALDGEMPGSLRKLGPRSAGTFHAAGGADECALAAPKESRTSSICRNQGNRFESTANVHVRFAPESGRCRSITAHSANLLPPCAGR
jgi:hypothetical protein